MKLHHFRPLVLLPFIILTGCGGGKKGADSVPIMGGGSAAEAAAAAAAEKAKTEAAAAAAAALAAPIKESEFRLTITPDEGARSAFAIPVHVLSLSKDEAARYRTLGADNYWKAPSGSAEPRVFGKEKANGPQTINVPFKDGADTILIIAKLPPAEAGGGGDARIMEIPLVRQAGADPLKPVAAPISVRLTRIGLLPN